MPPRSALRNPDAQCGLTELDVIDVIDVIAVHSATVTCHLFLFGVQLEALVQSAVVLLQMLLLLVPHALCVLHYLLLDTAKQTDTHTHTVTHTHTRVTRRHHLNINCRSQSLRFAVAF